MKLIYTQQYIISCIMSIGNTYLMSGLGITDEKSQEIDDYIKSMQDALNEIKNHKIEYYSNEAQEQQQSVTQIIELWNTIQNSEQGHMPPSMILEIAKTIRLLKDKIPKQYKNKDWYDDEKQTDINIASCLERMNN